MKNKNKKIDMTPSMITSSGEPKTVSELLNKYGTYEVQSTADTENIFPTIAQGLPKAFENSEITKTEKEKL